MINILIVDDNPEKQKKIKNAITSVLSEDDYINVESSVDVISAKRIMNVKDINIMILDLYLPIRFEDGAVRDGGKRLIEELSSSRRYKYPNYVISLSQHPEQTQEFKEFTDEIHKYINYDTSNDEWMIELKKYLLTRKTPQNPTSLLTSVTGFEENPTEIFLAEMQNIVPEMQDLPFFHKGIECFCPKFVLFEDQWIGTVLTPWMMSVVILPGPQQQWEPRELGDKLTVQLPYKALTFTVSSLENVPQYLSCSLHSPLDPNLTNEQAVQLTQDCLRMVLSIPTAQPTFNSDRRNLFKAMIK